MMSEEPSLREKKLRGSGGYALAKVTDEEQKRGNLGGPELFLAGVGRLPEERFSKYFCNKCEKEYKGSPPLKFENPNEDLGEGVTLAEKGEYKCATCDSTIAQYRKFDSSSVSSHEADSQQATIFKGGTDNKSRGVGSQTGQQTVEGDKAQSESLIARDSTSQESSKISTGSVDVSGKVPSEKLQEDITFQPIQSLVGMPAYDSEALLIGKVQEIGLRRSARRSGETQISVKINRAGGSNKEKSDNQPGSKNDRGETLVEILWNEISKIGDIVLLSKGPLNSRSRDSHIASVVGKCSSCGHQNEEEAAFCEECGNKLS
jgi:sporulation protein YlmC with PRC-barrel domain/DNA-directed RNA polymerase subunit RPC12/RpoP